MTRRDDLVSLIRDYATAYYLGEEKVSDVEFDGLVSELRQVDPGHEILRQVGWGMSIYGNKVKLPCPIRHSLDKIHEVTPDWFGALVSVKVDGMSCLLEYDDGVLKLAVTRGDGVHGIDITTKTRHIKSIPQRIFTDDHVVVRGELFVSLLTYPSYKNEYANPRSMVSGIVNSKSLKYIECVEFIAHPDDTHVNPVPYLQELIQSCTVENTRRSLYNDFHTYPTDGMVYRKRGTQEAVAYKFETEFVETTVKSVEWNTGRGGKLIPVVTYEPVSLYGTTCSRVSGLHYNYVYNNKIGPGARIRITKANEIIPQIVEVVMPSTLEFENYGPQVEFETRESDVHAYEVGHDLPKQVLNHFIKWHFDIDGFKRSDMLMRDVFGVNDFDDLAAAVETISNDPDAAVIQIQNNGMSAISGRWVDQASSVKYLNNFFMQLGINGIGESASTELDKFIRDDLTESDVIRFAEVADVNVTVREALVKYSSLFVDAFNSLRSRWSTRTDNQPVMTYTDKACITGKLSVTKEEFSKYLSDFGILSVDHVDSSVKYLVTPDDIVRDSSKLKKAKDLGLDILTESQMRGRLE